MPRVHAAVVHSAVASSSWHDTKKGAEEPYAPARDRGCGDTADACLDTLPGDRSRQTARQASKIIPANTMHEEIGASGEHFDQGAVGISKRRGTSWRDTGVWLQSQRHP
jgi:hypothetical protein